MGIKEYICPGSNRRPSACKADVITNYTTDALLIETKTRSYRDLNPDREIQSLKC